FDGIAAALGANPPRETLRATEAALLRLIPPAAATALDVGCGDGVLARAVARRGIRVLGLDLSPGMIALARARTEAGLDASFRVADVMTEPLPERGFDVVLSVNAVHHLPLDRVVPRLAAAVAPGGVLLIQDVVTREGLLNFPLNVVAAIVIRTRRFLTKSGE